MASSDSPQDSIADSSEIDSPPTPQKVVKGYLLEHVAEFRELTDVKRKGWENPEGDDHFKNQRSKADNADHSGQLVFYKMMQQIGDELNEKTSALQIPPPTGRYPTVLDLCMAPGGFTASVLKYNADARICGTSLPPEQGGHKIQIPHWQKNHKLNVRFLDLTLLPREMDVVKIPPDHPDASNFISERLFAGKSFDLVFCDGQVLRTHPRPDYREMREGSRLLTSQLVLAMQRIRENGRLIMLLHRADAWDTLTLLHTLSKFSTLQLFKPEKKHAIRSSFYVIADKVQPRHPDALRAVAGWKKHWFVATFGSSEEYQQHRRGSIDQVERILEEFGEEYIRLGTPVWCIQHAALRRSTFAS